MSRATETPWEVTPDGYRIWSEPAQRVVLFAATNPAGRTPEAREVARLAAAAPVLLASVKELVDAMQQYQMDVDEEAPFKHREMMARARAAIEKATGGDSE